jgi:multidrug transporter EmrE-like cation transporter
VGLLKTLSVYLPLLIYSIGMVVGQILLKQASLSVKGEAASLSGLVVLLKLPIFYVAVAWYGFLTIVWVWLLSLYPLSRAYPWVAVALAVTPLVGVWMYGEPFSWRLVYGLGLIGLGVLVISDGRA